MSNLIIKDGKFYRDGVEVPLEFGNWEQINLLKKSLKMTEEGSLVQVHIEERHEYDMSISFTCPHCLKNNFDQDVYEEFEPDDSDIKELIEANMFCTNCRRDLELKVETENNGNKKYYVIAGE